MKHVGTIFFLVLGSTLGCATRQVDEPPEAEAASPLKTTAHQQITEANCTAAGFRADFCARLGAEAFNVDRQEWDRLEAHAMPYANQSKCDAAALTQARLRTLGTTVRGLISKPVLHGADADQVASALGRALHTIQDNCAHQGMTNPQHAWYSNRGYCLSDGEDPDTVQAALDCAGTETRAILSTFAHAVGAFGHQLSDLVPDSSLGTANPDRDQVCGFLREWANFDGHDHRWDNRVTTPAFRDTLNKALTTGHDVPKVCSGATSSIAIPSPRPPVAVSDPMCFTEHVYCFGE